MRVTLFMPIVECKQGKPRTYKGAPMREHPYYRTELECLMAAFPNKAVLNTKEICEYTGKGRKWVVAHIGKGSASVNVIANKLCQLGET